MQFNLIVSSELKTLVIATIFYEREKLIGINYQTNIAS